MKKVKVLLYPQVTTGQGGPSNVARYLSDNLKNDTSLSFYPLFSASSGISNYSQNLVRVLAECSFRLRYFPFCVITYISER